MAREFDQSPHQNLIARTDVRLRASNRLAGIYLEAIARGDCLDPIEEDAPPPAITEEYTPLIERASGAELTNGVGASLAESDALSAVDVPRGPPKGVQPRPVVPVAPAPRAAPQFSDQAEPRAVAAIPAPAPPVRREPTVLQKPSSSRISQAYPAKAAQVRVQGASGYSHQMNGFALIRCQVERTGRLDRCTVVEEDPLGFGFGAAALGLASEYRFSPASINGEPVEGWAQIPIEWIGNQ